MGESMRIRRKPSDGSLVVWVEVRIELGAVDGFPGGIRVDRQLDPVELVDVWVVDHRQGVVLARYVNDYLGEIGIFRHLGSFLGTRSRGWVGRSYAVLGV